MTTATSKSYAFMLALIKKSPHQIEDFIHFPSHTHPFFIPNRPSHLPLSSYHPLYLYLISFFLTISHPLHLPFVYTSFSSPFLISPSSSFLLLSLLFLFLCHSISFVLSSFTSCCRPPSACSLGVCGSDNEAHS